MKANMFPRPEIAPLLKDFVLVDLYTDGTDAASEENAKMEEERYKTVSLPFYVILDADEHVIATFPGSTRDVQQFANFLKTRSPVAYARGSETRYRTATGMRRGLADGNETSAPQSSIAATKAGPNEGVGCGPGGPPHELSQAAKIFRSSSTYAQELPTKWRRRFRLRTDFLTASKGVGAFSRYGWILRETIPPSVSPVPSRQPFAI
jgi:hypothetical protein